MKTAIGVLLVFIAMATSATAQSPTRESLQKQVDVLLAQLAVVKSTTTATSSDTFIAGTRVETTDVVRVRSSYGIYSPLIALQSVAMTGVVQSGPFNASGYRWVNVNFSSGADGWVTTDWLRVLRVPTTATTSNWSIADIARIEGYNATGTSDIAYIFTLLDNRTFTIKATDSATSSAIIQSSGFVGDVGALLALVTENSVKQSTSTYTYGDVIRVQPISVDLLRSAIDDEGILYRIILSEDDVRTVTLFGLYNTDMVEKAFAHSGYKGDVEALRSWVAGTATERLLRPAVDGKQLTLSAVVSVADSRRPSVCGPTVFGTIDWGDGKSDSVFGLGCSARTQTVAMQHEYEVSGTYQITLRDKAGNISGTQVLVR
jgi:hypothetical protein